LLDLATSVAPYLALCVAMYMILSVSPLLVVALVIPTAGFLVRVFVVFHDCAHGSLLPSKRANTWVGTILGLLVLSPFRRWRHDHVGHHATSGDLDRRGIGDVPTLTVAEYQARSGRGRLAYRLFRHPLVMFGLGPVFGMLIGPRVRGAPRTSANAQQRTGDQRRLAGHRGRIVLADRLGGPSHRVGARGAVGRLCRHLAVLRPHQFEHAYWQRQGEWSYAEAALRGSSYLKLPKLLQFFTGNIGLHHVHHLHARIPNYNLQRAHDTNAIFAAVPTMSIRDGVHAVKFKLWDEDRGQLVTFAHANPYPQRVPT
jgi:omega-6 fatty acid desaturase (delta-12 desaturase)